MADRDRPLVDARWIGSHGIGRFAAEVIRRLPDVDLMNDATSPLSVVDPARLWWRCRQRPESVFFSPGFNPPLGRKGRFIFTLHDLIHVDVPAESSTAKSLYYRCVVKPACHRAAAVLTVSEFSRRRIAAWSGMDPERVQVVGNGVGPEYHPGVAPRHVGYPYLLYVGNQKPHKNIDGLLKAFTRARLPGDLRLVVSGRLTGAYRALATQLGISERVVDGGFIPEEELPGWYRGARALIMPSHYEGFGLPALEAMASGTPVVVSGTTALPEVVGEAAVVADSTEADAIAAAIERAYHPELAAALAKAGPQRARQFRWEAVAAAVWRAIVDAD